MRAAVRRLIAGGSPSGLAFAILIALALISVASRAWLLLKPLLVSRPGG